jgi:predicted DNA repair protein MutK
MASGVLGLLDDIATLMDDVATMSKVATKKTAGILADDLAVNAEKASGFVSSRELPILWKLTKGSFRNKLIILPGIFLLSAFLPVAIIPILICGGIYLSFEGALKIYEYFFKKGEKNKTNPARMNPVDAATYETKRVKSAILIDFILSIEIIIIALGTVLDQPLKVQIPVVTLIAVLATIGVYGVVALLVRMDDAGYRLIEVSESSFLKGLGNLLVKTLPIIIRILNVVGTLAMILVGGGIFVHNLHIIHDLVHGIPALLSEFIVGLVAGVVFLILFLIIKVIFKKGQKEN